MITKLENIVSGSFSLGLPTFEQIKLGHRAKAKVPLNCNPLPFLYRLFYVGDYFIHAAERMKDQVIIDIGAGIHLDGAAFAYLSGAKGYVAIEACNGRELLEKMSDKDYLMGTEEFKQQLEKLNHGIKDDSKYEKTKIQEYTQRIQNLINQGLESFPMTLVAEDMLTALKRLPEKSVSIVAGGIDRCIHPEEDYVLEVETQIVRALHSQGCYVGVVSIFEPSGLRDIYDLKSHWTFKVLAKY